ncbi:MAG: hypothetical protein MJ252_05430 [archaeon]|nr:hypothetical protein [archaeon]
MNENKLDLNYPRNDFYSLTNVIGFGSKSEFAMSSNSKNGLVSYITGPYLIFYDMKADKQVAFLKNTNNKIISCVDFSEDGQFLATGEGNCKNGEISIYKIFYDPSSMEEKHSLSTSFKNHKYGIEKVKFFHEDSFLISIGNKDDKNINIFDIDKNEIIFTTKYNRSIYGFDITDTFMVMTGDKFAKIYNFEKIVDKSYKQSLKGGMTKNVVDLAKLKDKAFIAASIYHGRREGSKDKTFFLTFDCFLAEMEVGTNLISRWVNLKSEKGLCLTIFGKNVACGCSDGILRLFHADTLAHIMSFHKPLPIGKINISAECKTLPVFPKETSKYPDVVIVNYNYYYQKLIATYSNGTTLFWDSPIADRKDREMTNTLYRSITYHWGSITSIDIIEKDNLEMATCSDDGTVIYWSINMNELMNLKGGFSEDTKIPFSYSNDHIQYSKYIKQIFYLNSDPILPFKISKENFFNEAMPEDEPFTLTSVKFTPDHNYIITSNNEGNIYIISLESLSLIRKIEVHGDCINSIDTSYDPEKSKIFLASGGSDNILSIINITDYLTPVKNDNEINEDDIIFEKLESPIISVQFCIDKYKELKIIAAENDSTITFYKINLGNNYSLQTVQKYKDRNLKTYCLTSSPTLNKILSGHNGQIRIWKTSLCIIHKHFQVCKGDKQLDNFRVTADKTGRMFATSNNDKIIRMRALHDGKLLTKIPIAESISALFFGLKDNYLIAASVEGYIYFYRLNMEYVEKLAHNNDLINSREENEKIQRKLKFLQQWIKYDNNLSKVEHVKYLIEKNMNSEELTFDDLKILDSYYKEEKSKFQSKEEADEEKEEKKRKKVEKIQLKEENPNNNDDLENENNQNEAENKNERSAMSRSKIFEIGLKEKKSYDSAIPKKSQFKEGRVSLADTYKNRIGNASINSGNVNTECKFQMAKDDEDEEKRREIHDFNDEDKKDDFGDKIKFVDKVPLPINHSGRQSYENAKDELNEIKRISKNIKDTVTHIEQINNTEKKKSSGGNKVSGSDTIEDNDIPEEINKFQTNLNNNPIGRYDKEGHCSDIPEEIVTEEKESKYDQSLPSKHDFPTVDNSQKKINESYVREMKITQSNFEFSPLSNEYKKGLIIKNNQIDRDVPKISYLSKPKENIRKVTKEANLNFKGNQNKKINCRNLIENIKNFDLNYATNTELGTLETQLENLLDNIRIKRGSSREEAMMEKMLSKYSALFIKRLEEKGGNEGEAEGGECEAGDDY